jgi:hypothetical protein
VRENVGNKSEFRKGRSALRHQFTIEFASGGGGGHESDSPARRTSNERFFVERVAALGTCAACLIIGAASLPIDDHVQRINPGHAASASVFPHAANPFSSTAA